MAIAPPTGGMVPAADLRPPVLPTDRLAESGMLRPDLRQSVRSVPTGRNLLNVAGAYAQSFGVVAAAVAIDHPVGWVVAFFLMGRAHALFGVLTHEAAHRLLLSDRTWNDRVGRWLLAYPTLIPYDVYRRGHMAHHRDELGPDEPDTLLYAGYPVGWASFRRKLTRDAFLVSGVKLLGAVVGALRAPANRRVGASMLAVQMAIAGGFALAGHPWLYLLLWLLPWLTVWRVLARLRAIAEHGGMARWPDRRATTHVVRQRPWARFWVAPYNTGWHLAHHVDSGVPFQRLPRVHEELVVAGYVPPGLEWPGYLALWRALASGATPAGGRFRSR